MPWLDVVNGQLIWGKGAVIKQELRVIGLIILTVALSMGIFTGLNGFMISTSRLLFSMYRAKRLPQIFSKLHPKYQTPYAGIIFTVIIAMLAPCHGLVVKYCYGW